MKIVTVEEMRRLEAQADAAGISFAEMMEHAGRAAAEAVLSRAAAAEANVVVLAGPGNNGGDGLVCARRLADAGAAVKVYSLKPPAEDDQKIIALRERSVFIVDAENDLRWRVLKQLMGGATVIVDALFGTGARLPLRGRAAQLLDQVSKAILDKPKAPLVIAVDCPSGTNCDTGEVDPAALKASLTVTFGAAKVGLFKFPAANVTGELIVAPIGWPHNLAGLKDISLELATAARAQAALPPRPRDAHKYQFGRALIVAGSKNYVGAAYLVGAAAGRIGAGLVTMAVPDAIHPILAGQLPVATWLPLAASDGAIDERAADSVRASLPRASALIIGPGLGAQPATAQFVRALAKSLRDHSGLRLLADADGLRLLAQIDGWPKLLPELSVLTPHPGEMAALTGMDKKAIQNDRLSTARTFAAEWGHVVLLKGAFTVIAAPDGRAVIEPFATAGLAKAGSGDVLSGIVGGLLAQGVEPFEAAVAGAFVHGRAAHLAVEAVRTAVSVTSADILDSVARAVAELEARD